MDTNPRLTPREYLRLTQAIGAIRDAQRPLSLDGIAGIMGLSRSEAQREFTKGTGLSPQRFQATLAQERARQRLAKGDSVLDAAMASGLSGPGRLHDLMVSTVAMTPGQVARRGAGAAFRWGRGETRWGRMIVGWSPLGLIGLGFAEEEDVENERRRWQQAWPEAEWTHDDDGAQSWLARVEQHLDGRVCGEPLPVALRGTNFQVRVWEALMALPEGAAASYGSLARAIGKPKGAQAVGQAVGANLLALLIPCHRVIRADGALGGYRWGPDRKVWLWAQEDKALAA